jgi:hypothetical protein
MFYLGLIDTILAEREREIQSAIRRRRLLQVEDGAVEIPAPVRRSAEGRPLSIRVRPTGG